MTLMVPGTSIGKEGFIKYGENYKIARIRRIQLEEIQDDWFMKMEEHKP